MYVLSFVLSGFDNYLKPKTGQSFRGFAMFGSLNSIQEQMHLMHSLNVFMAIALIIKLRLWKHHSVNPELV